MTQPLRETQATPELVSRQTCMSRLVYELQLLVAISLELQLNIHSMDLAHTSPASRKVLQSADSLSQRLQCIELALEALAVQKMPGQDMDFRAVLHDIFLEDVRERLLTGTREDVDERAKTAGQVDLF